MSSELQLQLQKGSAFSAQGLNQLCSLVSLSELKVFRKVCRKWNELVSLHPRYREARVQLGPNWYRESNALQLAKLTVWRQVTLNCFHYAENKSFFPRVWKTAGENVAHLTLAKVKITCMDFNAFLNACPAVETLIIADIEFTPEAIRIDVRQAPQDNLRRNAVRAGGGNVEERTALFCSHTDENFTSPEEFKKDPIVPIAATIKYLRFETMRYFPHCSLAYLAIRCRGTLEKLEIENTPVLGRPPNVVNLLPSVAQIRPRLLRLVTENAATLTSFTFFNNASGQELLNDMSTIPELRLHELILAVYREKPVLDWGHMVRDRPPLQEVGPFVALAGVQRVRGLRRLFMKTHWTPDVQNFFNQFRTRVEGSIEMEKLKLVIDSVVGGRPDLAFLTPMTVKEVVVGDVSGGDLRFGFEDRWNHGNNRMDIIQNCQYWTALPNTVTALTVAHKLPRTDAFIVPAISNGGLQLLTKLHVRDGRLFTDEVFQQVIEHLINLTDLSVRRARKATDSGFTGLPVGLTNILRTCESYALLDGNSGVTLTLTGRSIKELVHLRKLDLAGCPGISDISCRFGFEFKNLTHIDLSECVRVTDIGLFWLGRNNPTLIDVQLRKHVNVSHFGVNQFVGQVKTVRNVSVSRCVLERQMGAASYAQHPLLPEVAHLALPSSTLKARYQRNF